MRILQDSTPILGTAQGAKTPISNIPSEQRSNNYGVSNQGANKRASGQVQNAAPEHLELLKGVYGEKRLKQMGLIPCVTCESRVYQDGSDDPGVSFKTPQNVSPEASFGAVMAHEQEHVSREQQKAQAEDREVVSQSVTLHRSLCPECGKSYVAGGVTRTTTIGSSKNEAYQEPAKQDKAGARLDMRI